MIKSEVEKLYQGEFAISSPKEIDIEAIALCLGASIKYRPLKGCEARIVGVKNKAIISINSNSHPQRNRFSIGHELGHWMKHRGNVGNLCSKELITVNKSSDIKKIIDLEVLKYKTHREKIENKILNLIKKEKSISKNSKEVIIKSEDFIKYYISDGITPEEIKTEFAKKGVDLEIPRNFFTLVNEFFE